MTAPAEQAPIRVIDADTHLTEPHDLWTSRSPARWKDDVPQVREVDGKPVWTVGGQVLGGAGGLSVVRTDGSKAKGVEWIDWQIEDAHHAASHLDEIRLEVMDSLGIWAQIVYPNVVGFGGQRFEMIKNPELRALCMTIYNDAMAEMQAGASNRLFPMASIPFWDVDFAVRETQRAKDLGLKGVNLTSDPQAHGPYPDLGRPAWDPFWVACADLDMPVNFHIGASGTSMAWFGGAGWPSLDDERKLALGSSMLNLANGRVLGNLIFSGVLERHPKLKVVSVESGIGWIPYLLESMDWQAIESAAGSFNLLSMAPSEYFRRQIYACFWFEQETLVEDIRRVGEDNVMFETDFPHPTCLYPNSLDLVEAAIGSAEPRLKQKVLSTTAARVYNIPLP